MSKPNEYVNPSYPFNPNAPPPPYSNAGSTNAQPGPMVIALPPTSSGGLFLDEDMPVVVPPSASMGVATGADGAVNYLRNVSSLLVKQKIELIEIIAGFDTKNRFTMYDEAGRPVFYALEDSDFCSRACCGPARPFEMSILDIFQNEIIHINRPLACQCWCCFCCLMHVEVSSPRGHLVGKVQQQLSIFKSSFTVENAVGETILMIEGPCWKCSCGGDIVFKILSADGQSQLGSISKKWTGFAQEFLTDADNFKIDFPQNLDIAAKSTLIGALFLIDVMYFEKKK